MLWLVDYHKAYLIRIFIIKGVIMTFSPNRARAAVALLVSLFLGGPSLAQITIDPEPNPAFAALEAELGLSFGPIVNAETVTVDPLLMNGVEVDDRFFPAIFGKQRGSDNPTCTATLIGPGTILIAAHCVDDNPRVRFVRDADVVRSLCVIAPGWRGEVDNGSDIALCLLERSIRGIPYERVSFDLPRVGQIAHLTGYGCTEQGGERDGILRLGEAPIQNRPPGFRHSPGTLYTVASVAAGQAVLCPGDSGGPLYVMGGTLDGPRSVIGVNSATTFDRGVSLFAALGAPANAAFIRSFAEARGQQICGVNLELGCKAS